MISLIRYPFIQYFSCFSVLCDWGGGYVFERVFSYSNRSGGSSDICYGDLKGDINAEFDVPVYGQKELKLKKDYLFVAGTCIP